MIQAQLIDGHWRVVDDEGRRYLPAPVIADGAIGGSFALVTQTAEKVWEMGTRMRSREAHLLAGVLRVADELQGRVEFLNDVLKKQEEKCRQ